MGYVRIGLIRKDNMPGSNFVMKLNILFKLLEVILKLKSQHKRDSNCH